MSWIDSPLADLHRHLDGSLRPQTVRELSSKLGLAVPEALLFYQGMGLQEALSRFAFTLSLLKTPDSVARVASEICEDAARTNVSTLEIRFAPQLHDIENLEAIIDAALEGIQQRAGLILCGLYGEPPTLLERLVELGAKRKGVVGLDLAGGPLPSHSYKMFDYRAAFMAAERAGMGRTVHAGEGRPPQEIKEAIEMLHAQRIGHGTTLLSSPSVLALVVDREVVIEACPTSNVHTGVIQEASAHPLAFWLGAGVKACICTDNTLFSDVDSPTEHLRVSAIAEMTDKKMMQAIAFGHNAAFHR
jgi:adenosine deaminase